MYLFEVAKAAGYNPYVSGCYIRIPQKPKVGLVTEYIEGFPVSTSLYNDLVERDFTAFVLWYDLINDVIIDRTGLGINDAKSNLLRIPVNEERWIEWVSRDFKEGAKLFRWFKFRARGYKPRDDATTKFIVSQTKSFFMTNYNSKSAWSDYIEKMVKGKSNAEKIISDFQDAFIADFGSSSWYDNNVKDIANTAVFSQQIRTLLFNGISQPVGTPEIIFLGGGTASGKSTI
jgi:hypothetical protein